MYWSFHPFIYVLIHSSIHLCIHPFIYSFMYSSIQPFIYVLIHASRYWQSTAISRDEWVHTTHTEWERERERMGRTDDSGLVTWLHVNMSAHLANLKTPWCRAEPKCLLKKRRGRATGKPLLDGTGDLIIVFWLIVTILPIIKRVSFYCRY